MFSDDVYRNKLATVIDVLEAWARDTRDAAAIETSVTSAYWKMQVKPGTPGACPFELLLRADQRFNVRIGDEVYENKPVDQFEFFPMLVRAIERGNVERVAISSALTGALDAIETRVTLEDGWAWIGERRVGPRGLNRHDGAQVQRVKRFLPYRR
ncbi:MAG: hypothetical protein ABL893_15225 [Hyphomicrobium sp.]|nr:hypothetical protein [Hyphomicrobium sp.]